MIQDIKLGENEKCIFWDNGMARKFDKNYRMVMVEHKNNGFKEYLLIKNNKPIYNNTSAEAVWYYYEALRLAKELK